jgi:regulator of replication initiation timing
MVAGKEKELNAVMQRVNTLKREIEHLKQALDGNLNEQRIIDLENESKFLTKRIKDLEEEKASLQKIGRI